MTSTNQGLRHRIVPPQACDSKFWGLGRHKLRPTPGCFNERPSKAAPEAGAGSPLPNRSPLGPEAMEVTRHENSSTPERSSASVSYGRCADLLATVHPGPRAHSPGDRRCLPDALQRLAWRRGATERGTCKHRRHTCNDRRFAMYSVAMAAHTCALRRKTKGLGMVMPDTTCGIACRFPSRARCWQKGAQVWCMARGPGACKQHMPYVVFLGGGYTQVDQPAQNSTDEQLKTENGIGQCRCGRLLGVNWPLARTSAINARPKAVGGAEQVPTTSGGPHVDPQA